MWLSFVSSMLYQAHLGQLYVRHHEEKGHTQAFTIHNRTDKKNPENKLQSGKETKESSLT
jgi:hypothetical protein